MTNIRAIPTRVGGVQYRSRLEARWAVFMTELDWAFEYEPEGLAKFRILDFVLTEGPWATIVEVKPAFTLAEFEARRTTLQHEVREWMLEELHDRRRMYDEFPAYSLEEYDAVLADIERIERGEDALEGRRAIVVGSTLHNDRVRDGVTVDGHHYIVECGEISTSLALAGGRCLRCGATDHRPARASAVLTAWLSSGNTTQWQAAGGDE